MSVAEAAGASLFERDSALATAAGLVGAAGEGTGRLLVVSGEAGVGKTRVLGAVAERAASQGFLVLRTAGGAYESEAAFGVVRQLFERHLADLDDEGRGRLLAGPAGATASLLGGPAWRGAKPAADRSVLWHGLYWLTANLAAARALLLVVDDAHWADAPSGLWLVYLARRLGDLPVLLALGVRTGEPAPGWLADLVGLAEGSAVRLETLSRAGTEAMVRDQLGPDAAGEFCDACHHATGGNPFLTVELARALAAERVTPSAANAARVREISPETIGRSVLARLARLSPGAVALARAAAVLGPDAGLRLGASLAAVDFHAAGEAADALAAAGITTRSGLAFTHPILRTVIYNDLPSSWRSQAHAAAGLALAAEGAPAPSVAAHLLHAEPAGDRSVVELLRSAATEATAEGAPAAAATYLRRVLAEPPPPSVRAAVLAELGAAELRGRLPGAADHLAQSLDATAGPAARAPIALQLAQAQIAAGRLTAAEQALDAVLAELADAGEVARAVPLEAYRGFLGVLQPEMAAAAAQRAPLLEQLAVRAGDAGRPLYRLLAFRGAFAGDPPAQVLEMARRSIPSESVGPVDAQDAYWSPRALIFIDELELAAELLAELVRQARAVGSAFGYAYTSTWNAALEQRRGRVAAAGSEARLALDLIAEHQLHHMRPHASTVLADVLVETGQLSEASRVLEGAGYEAIAGTRPGGLLLHTRARVRLASGDRRSALEDLRTYQQIQAAVGLDNPNVLPWRSTLALTVHRDDPGEAADLAADELARARRVGQARAVGVALRTQGLLAGGDESIQLLRLSADTLEHCPSLVERAATLAELGASLRRARHPRDARDPLRRAVDLARRAGAVVLAERANQELLATGARPRRPYVTGPDSLTPTEVRIASLATTGLTNRQIAEALFVSTNTVATHLSHIFQKLHVGSRSELTQALNPGFGPARTRT